MMYVSLLPQNIVCATEGSGTHWHKSSAGNLERETFAVVQKYQRNKHSRSKLDVIQLFVEI